MHAYIHTYIHTYIGTGNTHQKRAASQASRRTHCVQIHVLGKTEVLWPREMSSWRRQRRLGLRRDRCVYVCMYVCMYGFCRGTIWRRQRRLGLKRDRYVYVCIYVWLLPRDDLAQTGKTKIEERQVHSCTYVFMYV